jgi:hypothetical protein
MSKLKEAATISESTSQLADKTVSNDELASESLHTDNVVIPYSLETYKKIEKERGRKVCLFERKMEKKRLQEERWSVFLKVAVKKNRELRDTYATQLREFFEINEGFGLDEFLGINFSQLQHGETGGEYLRIFLELTYVDEKFAELAEKWYLDTLHSSGYLDKVLHPAYQQIIGMGKDVIRNILHELQDEPSEWFWALRALTGEDPTTDEMAGNREKLTEAWLNWGKENGYI